MIIGFFVFINIHAQRRSIPDVTAAQGASRSRGRIGGVWHALGLRQRLCPQGGSGHWHNRCQLLLLWRMLAMLCCRLLACSWGRRRRPWFGKPQGWKAMALDRPILDASARQCAAHVTLRLSGTVQAARCETEAPEPRQTF